MDGVGNKTFSEDGKGWDGVIIQNECIAQKWLNIRVSLILVLLLGEE